MSKNANVTMLPCLITHHEHKVRTLSLKLQELQAGLLKDGCPPELLDVIKYAGDAVGVLGERLASFKGNQEATKHANSAANRAARVAEQEARRAARLATKSTTTASTPTTGAPERGPIEITTSQDGTTQVDAT